MRYLNRSKIYEKVSIIKEAKKLYIFCEGENTEINYFKHFQGLSSNIDIIPIPNENGKSDPLKLKQRAELLFAGNATTAPKYILTEEYNDEIWFVIDTDHWNEGNKIQQLKDFCSLKNQIKTQWFVAQSNPCFELWLFYHFNENKPLESEVKAFSTFKEYVNNQIRGGFDSRIMPIELQSAINNSSRNFDVLNGQPSLYSTEMHLLGIMILSFVKLQLDKAKEMVQNHQKKVL